MGTKYITNEIMHYIEDEEDKREFFVIWHEKGYVDGKCTYNLITFDNCSNNHHGKISYPIIGSITKNDSGVYDADIRVTNQDAVKSVSLHLNFSITFKVGKIEEFDQEYNQIIGHVDAFNLDDAVDIVKRYFNEIAMCIKACRNSDSKDYETIFELSGNAKVIKNLYVHT